MAGPLAGSGTHAPDGEPAALPHQRAAGPLEAVGLPSAHLAVLGGGRPAGTASGGIPAAAGSGQGPGKPARVLSCKGVRLPGTQCPRAAFADGGGGGQRLGTSGGRAAQVPPRCLQRELEEYIQDMGIPAGPVFITRSGKPMSRTSVTTAIQHLAKSAGVEPGKCNPRCLRKLYLATLQGFQRQVTQLVEQAHNSLVEQEQAVVGWSVG